MACHQAMSKPRAFLCVFVCAVCTMLCAVHWGMRIYIWLGAPFPSFSTYTMGIYTSDVIRSNWIANILPYVSAFSLKMTLPSMNDEQRRQSRTIPCHGNCSVYYFASRKFIYTKCNFFPLSTSYIMKLRASEILLPINAIGWRAGFRFARNFSIE